MKIIDLLNKIANKEDLPKKIKYCNDCWKVGFAENGEIDYLNDCELELFSQYLEHALIESLNDEVELLEDEETNIEEIEKLNPSKIYFKDGTDYIYPIMYNKINEIIRVVNKMQLDNKIKEK